MASPRLARGLKPAGLALLAGVAAALAHPPFGFSFGLAGFGLWLYLLDDLPAEHSLRSAFWRSWLVGCGYFLVGTWWVGEAFFVDAAAHGWQAPFAVFALAGGVALFWGAAGLCFVAFRASRPRFGGAFRILVFAAVLTGFEWLRGHVLTGFPWDLPGESWRAGSAPSQTAALVGAYGLTLITVIIGASAVTLCRSSAARARGVALGLAALLLVGLYGYGGARLAAAHDGDIALRLRLVQPDLGEEATWTAKGFTDRFTRFLDLTAQPSAHRPDVVIWPEGAIPASFNDYLAPGSWTQIALARALAPGQILLVGGYRSQATAGRPLYFNSLLALRRAPDGESLQVLGVYDKHRLVPFGEYVPFAPLFARLGLTQLVQAGEPFTMGPPSRPLFIAGLPRLQVLICYESLFPELAKTDGSRPGWIVNVSDDAWFGRTSGPVQHLNLASYRAIEQGLPMARSTPTGISAVIDSYGRVKAQLGLGVSGIVDANLPTHLEKTPYSRLGDFPLGSVIILICVLGLL